MSSEVPRNSDTPIAPVWSGTMSPELTAALDRVKGYVMSPAEVFEQRVSFVYGQQDYDDPNPRPKDQIREMLAGIYGIGPVNLHGNCNSCPATTKQRDKA